MAGGSLDCVSKVSPQTNEREKLNMTLILAQPSSLPSLRLWQCADNDDEYNLLIRSILLRTWTWSRFKRETFVAFSGFSVVSDHVGWIDGKVSRGFGGSERIDRTVPINLRLSRINARVWSNCTLTLYLIVNSQFYKRILKFNFKQAYYFIWVWFQHNLLRA